MQAGADRVEGAAPGGAAATPATIRSTQQLRPGEQDLALVREVPEQGPLGQAGAGDLRGRRLVETLLGVERAGRPAAGGRGLPGSQRPMPGIVDAFDSD